MNYLIFNHRLFFNKALLCIIFGTIIFLFFTGCGPEKSTYTDNDAFPDVVDFNLHVRSILSENCFACHGPDANAREAELRLDTEEGAFAPLKVAEGSYAIVRGNPGRSELFKRITSDDPDYVMPTPGSNLSLTDEEVAILIRWIEQGAEYKPHWSYIPPVKPDLPQVKNTEWPENPIDHFVLEKIENEGLEPSEDASKEKLFRRVSFDLTGLPPTVEELDNFLLDESPDAYERVVDRLLASQAYGERMATEWLDLARYADTHGYQDDGPNEMWPWREWVISAFNRNIPFDQFTTWQLAGDLLPDATREQKLATGFGRVHPQSQEGGIIGEEYQVEYVADRVYTTGTTFLGMTMQCARCHDHKYDPVSEKEYYQFAAFFDNINDTGQIPNEGAAGPTMLLPDEETDQLIGYLEQQITDQVQELHTLKAGKTEEFLRWSEEQNTNSFLPDVSDQIIYLDLNEINGDTAVSVQSIGDSITGRVSGELKKVKGVNGAALEFQHSHFINLGRNTAQFERTNPFSFSFWINPSDTSKEVPVLAKTGAIYIGYRGYDISLFENRVSLRLIHGWPYNSIQVLTHKELKTDEWSHVVVTYDGSSRANGIQIYINGVEQETLIEQNNLFKNIVIPEDARYSGQNFFIGHRNSFDDLRYKGLKLDEIRIFDRQLSPLEAMVLAGKDDEVNEMFATAPGQYSDYQNEVLFNHYLLQYDPDFSRITERLQELRIEKSTVVDTLQEVMVMEERINPRKSYVRERGMYDQLGEEVEPGVPEAIMEFPDNLPQNRLGLAHWILSDEHPLTSRVIVNRYWQMFFGKGLVDTPEDFGNQGSMPSHPELLDWLAVTFRENDWNIKDFLKKIVMSRTYRQSSVISPELSEKDPENRLLARGPRYRLPAEMIRDNALAASGLLVEKIGGPSVKPYQPEGLWAETTSGRHLSEYIRDEGESLYRRSLYTFWKRTAPPPGMMTFDAAMRTHPTAKRGQTSTPLQALNTMNDPQYVEASRILAERMLKVGGENLDEQIEYAYKAVTSRAPKPVEIKILKDLYYEELNRYREEPEDAVKLLSVGEHPADETLDSHEIAARTIIASTILNLDETITKE